MTTALSDADKLGLASRFAAASRGGDNETYRSMCTPDVITWHNFDELEVDIEQSLRAGAWLRRKVPDLVWNDIAVLPTSRGFVSQSILTGTAPGGPLRLHSCLVVTVDEDGLVSRVDEYLDTAQTAPLRG